MKLKLSTRLNGRLLCQCFSDWRCICNLKNERNCIENFVDTKNIDEFVDNVYKQNWKPQFTKAIFKQKLLEKIIDFKLQGVAEQSNKL